MALSSRNVKPLLPSLFSARILPGGFVAGGSVGKNLPAQCRSRRRHRFDSQVGKIASGEEMASPLQYSCLEDPKDRGSWWATVHGVAKSWTRLSVHAHTHTHRHTHTSWIQWVWDNTQQPSSMTSSLGDPVTGGPPSLGHRDTPS